jgi:hypothetical protein
MRWLTEHRAVLCTMRWLTGHRAVLCTMRWLTGHRAVLCTMRWLTGHRAVLCTMRWLTGHRAVLRCAVHHEMAHWAPCWAVHHEMAPRAPCCAVLCCTVLSTTRWLTGHHAVLCCVEPCKALWCNAAVACKNVHSERVILRTTMHCPTQQDARVRRGVPVRRHQRPAVHVVHVAPMRWSHVAWVDHAACAHSIGACCSSRLTS